MHTQDTKVYARRKDDVELVSTEHHTQRHGDRRRGDRRQRTDAPLVTAQFATHIIGQMIEQVAHEDHHTRALSAYASQANNP